MALRQRGFDLKKQTRSERQRGLAGMPDDDRNPEINEQTIGYPSTHHPKPPQQTGSDVLDALKWVEGRPRAPAGPGGPPGGIRDRTTARQMPAMEVLLGSRQP